VPAIVQFGVVWSVIAFRVFKLTPSMISIFKISNIPFHKGMKRCTNFAIVRPTRSERPESRPSAASKWHVRKVEDEQAVRVVIVAGESHTRSSWTPIWIKASMIRANIHTCRICRDVSHLLGNCLVHILHMAIGRIVALMIVNDVENPLLAPPTYRIEGKVIEEICDCVVVKDDISWC